VTERLFLDTNVWVYAVDRTAPAKHSTARALLQPTPEAGVVVSPQVLSEFFAGVTRELTDQVPVAEAREMVTQMSRLPVVPIDARLVEAAITGTEVWQLSYWDALIIVDAQSSGCRRVLSEDMAHGAVYGSVQVDNPFRASEVAPAG